MKTVAWNFSASISVCSPPGMREHTLYRVQFPSTLALAAQNEHIIHSRRAKTKKSLSRSSFFGTHQRQSYLPKHRSKRLYFLTCERLSRSCRGNCAPLLHRPGELLINTFSLYAQQVGAPATQLLYAAKSAAQWADVRLTFAATLIIPSDTHGSSKNACKARE